MSEDLKRFVASIYLSPSQVAEARHINERTVRRAIQSGRLQAEKVPGSGRWRISILAFYAWVQAGQPTVEEESDKE